MNKLATNTPQKRGKSAAETAKERGVSPKIKRIRDESATEPRRIRYAFAPILRQFRAHTRKNEARLWIPIETNLISRYEFATLSPQCRYVFVAILLYCAGNGIDEIPLDAKFMSSVLSVDFRTIENSFVELLFQNLLQERKEREEKKEPTDRTDAAGAGAVCVVSENLFQDEAEAESRSKSNLVKGDFAGTLHGIPKHSQFSLEECLKYVGICEGKGEKIQSPNALANHLFKSASADALIMATLYPERLAEAEAQSFGEPVKFSGEKCSVCFGVKLADPDGKGFRKCEHCKNERGKATGFEPEEFKIQN